MDGRYKRHLKVLGILHYVLGGLVAALACIPAVYVGVGLVLLSSPLVTGLPSPDETRGWIFAVSGAIAIIVGWTLAILIVTNGGRLRKQRGYSLAFAVAWIECLLFPLGTVLAVFTFFVLSRSGVEQLFVSASQKRHSALGTRD